MATVEQVKGKILDKLFTLNLDDMSIADIEKYVQILQGISGVTDIPYWMGVCRGMIENELGGKG